MLFDIRRIRVHSLVDFGREYLMIVIGILTALGLEHVATEEHDAKVARQSQEQIVAEIRLNLQEIRSAHEQNLERLKPIVALARGLKKDIESGVSRDQINRQLHADLKWQSSIGYDWPTLRHDAWDAAIANQSVTHIEAEAVRRFAATYASQRDATTLVLQTVGSLMNGSHIIDLGTDLEFGRVDPMEFLKSLRNLVAAVSSVNSAIEQLQGDLEKSLVGEPDGAKPGAPAPK